MAGKMTLRNFKLSEVENAKLMRDAFHHRMNVSAYIRWLVEEERTRCLAASRQNAEVDKVIRLLDETYQQGALRFGDWQALHDAVSNLYARKERG